MITFIQVGPASLDNDTVVEEVKQALHSLKGLVIGIILSIDIRIIRSLKIVWDDWQKKRRLANSILADYTAFQSCIQDSNE